MFSKRNLLLILITLSAAALMSGAYYVYKKKFVKIPSINPTTSNISDINTKDSYLNKKHIIFVDFENYEKKEELDDKLAYSGKYSYKVFGKNSFSAVVGKNVSDIGKENFIRVGFSAFVYVFNENFKNLKADLVFSIVDKAGNNVVWKGVTMSNVFMKPNQWTKITGAFDIDINTIPEDGVIKTYLWNDSKTNILIDDILVVVGNDLPYRGDTTYCDVSVENGWPRLFNYPPFPWQYLIKDEIGNENSACLVKNKSTTAGKIYPQTKICTGNFYNTQNLKDKIIAVEGNTLNAYSYCEQSKSFSNDLSFKLTEKDALWSTSNLYSGKFEGRLNDEILLIDSTSKKINLLVLKNETQGSCTAKVGVMKLNKLWEGSFDNFKYNDKEWPVNFTVTYLINSQKAQLLCVYSSGNWQIFEYLNKNWNALAKSNNPIKDWDAKSNKYNLVSGRFLPKANADILLSVSTSLKANASTYSLWAFNKENKTFTELSSSRKSKVWGIDTLKASDYLFTVKNELNGTTLMRYHNDWRFDMKNIAFNDSSYQILSNIDFKGHPNDFNPKYYEALRIIPGCFIDKQKTSLITICYNNKNESTANTQKEQYVNHDFLPNAIYVFTLKNN